MKSVSEESLGRQYPIFNPNFVRKVWAKRRREQPKLDAVYAPYVRKTSRQKIDQETLNLIAEMLLASKTSGQIGQRIGKTKSAVISIVRRLPELRAIGFRHGNGVKAVAPVSSEGTSQCS